MRRGRSGLRVKHGHACQRVIDVKKKCDILLWPKLSRPRALHREQLCFARVFLAGCGVAPVARSSDVRLSVAARVLAVVEGGAGGGGGGGGGGGA